MVEPGSPVVITLHHAVDTRSFRALWALTEVGLPYRLLMWPFPPRDLAPAYLDDNPLGTVPLLVDGHVRMTKSAGHLPLSGDPRRPEPARARHGRGRLRRLSELAAFRRGDADLPAGDRAALLAARTAGAAPAAGGGGLCALVRREAPSSDGHGRDPRMALRRPFHDGRRLGRLRAPLRRHHRPLGRASIPTSPPIGRGSRRGPAICAPARRRSVPAASKEWSATDIGRSGRRALDPSRRHVRCMCATARSPRCA